jgi:CTP:molybdopterin cytidylyltransferase MocA
MPERAPAHAAVVLAAGASTRFGRCKQLALLDGETLVHRAARLALATDAERVVVVVGAQADAVWNAVRDLDVVRADSSDHGAGMGASLRAGLGALPADIAGALIVVCDQPALDAAHLRALTAAWRAAPQRAVASAYAQRLGVPALLPRAWFGEIAYRDSGARQLLARRRADVAAIENEALARDIDWPGDLE